nr:auxin response factor 18-like [Tanacetum cinerariifolium]
LVLEIKSTLSSIGSVEKRGLGRLMMVLTGGRGNGNGNEFLDKLSLFSKALTQSNANNGGVSVRRFCADTIFPRLDKLSSFLKT